MVVADPFGHRAMYVPDRGWVILQPWNSYQPIVPRPTITDGGPPTNPAEIPINAPDLGAVSDLGGGGGGGPVIQSGLGDNTIYLVALAAILAIVMLMGR